jgi:asparagine synthase (glutamine-hydrolysing)
MGGICGSFGTTEQLEALVGHIKREGERELYVKEPGVAITGKEGKCLGDGFFFGKLYSDEDINDFFGDTIDETAKAFSAFVHQADGEYVITSFENGKLCLARDFYGKMPLFTQQEPTYQFSTNRRGFQAESPERLPAGETVVVKKNKVSKRYARRKFKFEKDRKDFFTTLPLIQEELDEAIRRRAAACKNLTILFSGGIDSALLAHCAREHADVSLVTVGQEGCEDREMAEALESEIGITLQTIDLTTDDIDRYGQELTEAIGGGSVLDFEIAFPFFMAARTKHADLLISGQGADELFGGYHRYNLAYKESPQKFEEMQLNDLSEIGRTNLERDQLAVRAGGSHLTTPYLTPKMIEYALSTETMTKINVRQNKLVLRKIAEKMGLPPSIAERKKKAIQYGCGIHSLLSKMAKERSFTKEKAKESGFKGPLEMVVKSFE